MYKNRLEEIKEIHEKANYAYARYENSSACADQDTITDSLSTLFYEEHTDWLIEQAKKTEIYKEALMEIGSNKFMSTESSIANRALFKAETMND